MFDDIEIYKVPEDRRYWLVRADGGKYYNHFTTYGLIGLGHVDSLTLFSGKKILTPKMLRFSKVF